MGQILLEDKIGALSHSSGVITLQASRLTIGGQQYNTTAAINRTISTDLTMVANTLYMIYAVLSGGVVQLRISANVNSIGPAGFSAWKLVGAFYSNSTSPVAFGSFVNIEGTPRSGEIDITLSGTNWTLTPIAGKNKYSRDGKFLEFHFRFTSSAAAAAIMQINLPPNIVTSSSYSTDSAAANPVGVLGTMFAGELAFFSAKPLSAFLTVNLFRLATYASGISANANALGNGDLVGAGRVAIESWDNTPIKDL